MVCPDQPMAIFPEPDQPYPLQGRPRQVKPLNPLVPRNIGERSLQPRLLPSRGPRAPVFFDKRHLGTTIDNLLRRAGQVAPDETGPQHRMTIADRLPCTMKLPGIEAAHLCGDLVDIKSVLSVVHRMKQHALLHRRQRIDVLYLSPIELQPVEISLAKT